MNTSEEQLYRDKVTEKAASVIGGTMSADGAFDTTAAEEACSRARRVSEDLLDFIAASPSCYHAAENVAQALKAHGWQELSEAKAWALVPGGRYFTRRNVGTVIAFTVPEGELKGFQIGAAHCDSPTFRIKENMEIAIDGAYTELNVEKYGGMLCAPWFDRPLSVAGRIAVRTPEGVESRLVNVDRDLMMLPSLAIHMDRSVNDGHKYSIQNDMRPLLGDERASGQFMRIVADAAGVAAEDILGSDLFLYCRGRGTVWGASNEYISTPKLDDLQCAYAVLQAFLASAPADGAANVCAIFNNEEIGSKTRQGAASTVLQDTLRRINEALGGTHQDYLRALASSYLVSADNAHAVHPNYLSAADPTNHPHMNEGIVIKYSGYQRYTTDGISAALFRTFCERAGVPTQTFHNHSDSRGGGTLGNISIAQVSVNSVDIGLPQLAMHSAVETAGVLDTAYLIDAMSQVYSSRVEDDGRGGYRVRAHE